MFAITTAILKELNIVHCFYQQDNRFIFCTPIAFSSDGWKVQFDMPPATDSIKLFIKVAEHLYTCPTSLVAATDKIYIAHISFPSVLAKDIDRLVSKYEFEHRSEKRHMIIDFQDFNLRDELQRVVIDNKSYFCKVSDVSFKGLCLTTFDIENIRAEIARIQLSFENSLEIIELSSMIVRIVYGKNMAKISFNHIEPINPLYLDEVRKLELQRFS
ncbi:MAG: hypothetical protein ACRC5H_04400 [Treponemataceae bacterium]